MNKIKHLYHSRSFIIRETTTGAKNKLKKNLCSQDPIIEIKFIWVIL